MCLLPLKIWRFQNDAFFDKTNSLRFRSGNEMRGSCKAALIVWECFSKLISGFHLHLGVERS